MEKKNDGVVILPALEIANQHGTEIIAMMMACGVVPTIEIALAMFYMGMNMLFHDMSKEQMYQFVDECHELMSMDPQPPHLPVQRRGVFVTTELQSSGKAH